jgi:hypothetical protein
MLWFAPNRNFFGRVLILLTLLFVNGTYLFVLRRLTPRWGEQCLLVGFQVSLQ